MLSEFKNGNKKNDKDAIRITYPIVEHAPYFNLRKKKKIVPDTSAKYADSLMTHNNSLLVEKCKWIKVTGVPGIDTLISIYNNEGIRAAGLFNKKKIYNCEISISLKLLDMSANDGSKFFYHIRVNGAKSIGTTTVMYATPGHEAMMERFVAGVNETDAQLSAPTDFWGEYTLTKK